jgi:hypothetical protein
MSKGEIRNVTRRIVIPKYRGVRLELPGKSPATIEFIRRPLPGGVLGIRLTKPWEINLVLRGSAQVDEVDFARTLAYFSSPHMARITADSKIMFNGAEEARVPVEIDGFYYLAKLSRESGDISHMFCSTVSRDGRSADIVLGHIKELFSWIKLGPQDKWEIFNRWAHPFEPVPEQPVCEDEFAGI